MTTPRSGACSVRLLEVEGYKVTEAMTGAEAIGSLANGQPDLVILDVMLTTEDGFDVLAAIRRTSNVPGDPGHGQGPRVATGSSGSSWAPTTTW